MTPKSALCLLFMLFTPMVAVAMSGGVEKDSVAVETKKSLYQGYIGGVMVHGGYGFGGVLTPTGSSVGIPVEGFAAGIGGRLLVNLGDNFRVGTEGYVSTITYGEHRKADIGWGGLAVDYGWQVDKFRPYFGVTIGGGAYENMTTIDEPLNDNSAQEVVWHSYGVFLVVPYVALEYSVTQKIRLCFRLDWITSPTASSGSFTDFSSGPRLHLGFMFAH
ncbi:MAG: hypothetical protein R3Y61_03825 [Rikenellaceae bacterium]